MNIYGNTRGKAGIMRRAQDVYLKLRWCNIHKVVRRYGLEYWIDVFAYRVKTKGEEYLSYRDCQDLWYILTRLRDGSKRDTNT